MSRGFLGTAAPWSSDATLIIELGMGVALLVGWRLARRGRYRAHAWCQSATVLLNPDRHIAGHGAVFPPVVCPTGSCWLK